MLSKGVFLCSHNLYYFLYYITSVEILIINVFHSMVVVLTSVLVSMERLFEPLPKYSHEK